MGNPWEKYQTQKSGPWSKYSTQQEQKPNPLQVGASSALQAVNDTAGIAIGNPTNVLKGGYDIVRALGHDFARNWKDKINQGIENKVVDYTTKNPNMVLPAAAAGAVAQTGVEMLPTTVADVGAGAIGMYGLTRGPITKMAGKLSDIASAKRLGKSEKLVSEATQEYRDMLRPTQAEIKNIEIRGRKNIDDMYQIAAEEELPIKTNGSKSDTRLDTSEARTKVMEKLGNIHDEINKRLNGYTQTFNLTDVAEKAKAEIRETVRNAAEQKKALADVDEYINSERELRGEILSAKDFNEVKQGMWSVGYDSTRPTTKANARKIGHVIKEELDKALKDEGVKELNDLSAKYSTLENLLENANGRIVQGGKMGRYIARTIGAIAGSKGGPLGSIAGQEIGARVANAINAPERATAVAASKMKKAYKLNGRYAPQIEKLLGSASGQ